MTITKKSLWSQKERTREIPIKKEDYDKWEANEGLIQDIAPYLTDDDREFLISGMSPEEFDECFPPDLTEPLKRINQVTEEE